MQEKPLLPPDFPHLPLQSVAFDMDGLMFDTETVYWKAADALLRKRGHRYTQELCNEIMGRPPEYCFRRFKEFFHFPEPWQELQRESEDFFLQFLDEGYSTMPGLYELLQFLEERNISKGICTSSAKRVVTEVLSRKELTHRFHFVLTAEDVSRGKPDPEIYLEAAGQFGIEASKMLVLEDSVAGCQAARNAGAFSVVVLAQHNQDGDFSAAHRIVSSLDAADVFTLFSEMGM